VRTSSFITSDYNIPSFQPELERQANDASNSVDGETEKCYSGFPTVFCVYAFCRTKNAFFFCPCSEMRPLRLKKS
jgi:hypothetical protein